MHERFEDQPQEVRAGVDEIARLRGISRTEAFEKALKSMEILRLPSVVDGVVYLLEVSRVEARLTEKGTWRRRRVE